ncbi:Peptidase C39 family protein, partial [Paracidovorax cattleyae]
MAEGRSAPQAHGGPGWQALQSLCLIARLHQVAGDPAALAHQLGLSPSEPVGVSDLLRAAQGLGLKARKVSCGVERLALTPLPALALVRERTAEGEGSGVASHGVR